MNKHYPVHESILIGKNHFEKDKKENNNGTISANDTFEPTKKNKREHKDLVFHNMCSALVIRMIQNPEGQHIHTRNAITAV